MKWLEKGGIWCCGKCLSTYCEKYVHWVA